MFDDIYGCFLILTLCFFLTVFIDKKDKARIERHKIFIEQHDNLKQYDHCIEYNDKFYCY